MRKLLVTVTGVSPLMMDQMGEDVLTSLATGVRIEQKKDTPDRDVAAKKIYRDNKERIGLPSTMLLAALVEAGRQVSYQGKTNISTADSTKLHAFMRIEEDHLIFPVGEGQTEAEWCVDKRRGRLDSGVAVCLRRPKFPKWGFTCTVIFDDKMIGQDKIEKLFETAGRFQGLGSFRPNCRGPFGIFATTKVEDVTPEEWKKVADKTNSATDEEDSLDKDGDESDSTPTNRMNGSRAGRKTAGATS